VFIFIPMALPQYRLDCAGKRLFADRLAQKSHSARLRRPSLQIITRVGSDENDWNPIILAAQDKLLKPDLALALTWCRSRFRVPGRAWWEIAP
jgi:hypothetical protein